MKSVEKEKMNVEDELAGLAHDLLQPFYNIQALISHIDADLKKNSYQLEKNYLGLMKTSCQNSINLIKSYLNHAGLSATDQYETKKVDLVQEIRKVLEIFKIAAVTEQKTLRFIHQQPHFYLNVDPAVFMQVVRNLLNNALKFTTEKGKISIALSGSNDKIYIEVKDDGIGIPEHLHKTLFDKFTSSRRTGLKGQKPIGLGLSIVKKVVEKYQGKISFTSDTGKGTTFYLEFPVNI